MKLDEYLFRNKLTPHMFAKKIGMGPQTLLSILKGKNATRNNIARVLAATKFQVDFWELMPDDLRKEFEKDILKTENPNQLKLPTNDELLEQIRSQKARWESKFSGMCC